MTVWSLTPFLNEEEVFEIRLAELDPVVDVHVVAESMLTYSGDPKPLNFRRALESGRYDRWRDKIRYVVVVDSPRGKDGIMPALNFEAHDGMRWNRENHQRDALIRGCEGMLGDDVVLLSDADEIPCREMLAIAVADPARFRSQVQRIHLPQHVMYLNWRWREYTTQAICRVTSGVDILNRGPQGVRELDVGEPWHDGHGWHLSYMGGAEQIIYKIKHAAHSELDDPRWTAPDAVSERMRLGKDMFGREGRGCRWVPLSKLPEHVRSERGRFEHLLIAEPSL